MAAQFEIKIEGLPELEAKLKELGPKISRKVMRKGLQAAGDLILEDAQSLVPVDDGALLESLVNKVRVASDGMSGRATIGTTMLGPQKEGDRTSDPGIYGTWIEFGEKNRKYTHKPFLRPAFDPNAGRALELFAKTLVEAIEEESSK